MWYTVCGIPYSALGGTMAWPKSDDKKTEVLTIKISQRQLQVLERYVQLKGLSSNADGIRRMIDGAEAWLRTQATPQATVEPPVASHQDVAEHHITDEADEGVVHSGLEQVGGYTMISLPEGSEYSDDGESLPGDRE